MLYCEIAMRLLQCNRVSRDRLLSALEAVELEDKPRLQIEEIRQP
jgi:hypothetical protein